jgi:predicted amidohydrolase YtcJ
MRLFWKACAILGLGWQAAAAQTIFFSNATFYTLNPEQPRAEAMIVRDGVVMAIGPDHELRKLVDMRTPEIDLDARTVIPGLIDAHGHMAALGSFGMGLLDLSGVRSYQEFVEAVGAAAKRKKPGEWILGGRWDHESWQSAEAVMPAHSLPDHAGLSEAAPENPVWLRRVDGHAGIANEAAMRLAGITAKSPNPDGGEIIRSSSGDPTGVFIDNAMGLIERIVPAGARGDPESLLLKAQEMCLRAGLTGVHDAGVAPAEIALYRRLNEEGKLKLRMYLMVSGPHAMRWFDQHEPEVGEHLTIRAAKLYMDGAMGSRGAWLLEPYADRPRDDKGQPYTGLAVSDPAMIEAVARHALGKGYQVCTHAIGDRANREVLDAYERAAASAPEGRGLPDARFRIEHAQLLSGQDIPRFAALGVVASMQPTHCTSDMRWVEARVGPERARGAYAWASLLASGAHLAGGSDFPVESHNPFLGLYAAVTRQDLRAGPAGGWMPQEKLTREQALHAFTLGAAYAAFQEDRVGSLMPGKRADFIVIDPNYWICTDGQIPTIRVLRTVIGGETVFEGDLAR